MIDLKNEVGNGTYRKDETKGIHHWRDRPTIKQEQENQSREVLCRDVSLGLKCQEYKDNYNGWYRVVNLQKS